MGPFYPLRGFGLRVRWPTLRSFCRSKKSVLQEVTKGTKEVPDWALRVFFGILGKTPAALTFASLGDLRGQPPEIAWLPPIPPVKTRLCSRLRFARLRPWSASRSLIGCTNQSCLFHLSLFSFGGVPDSTLGWSAPLPVENEGFS